MIIKKIISFEEWGFSPLAEKEWFSPIHKFSFKFNYWDYIQSFSHVLLYENNNKRHSWFLKICENCFHTPIPNWFFMWWRNFGTTSDIFPEHMKTHIKSWMQYSPTVNDCKALYIIKDSNICLFFIEFGVPWIWKWKPVFGYNEMFVPCIKRQGLSKYWDKLDRLCPDSTLVEGEELYKTIKEKIQIYKKSFEQNQAKKDMEIPSPFQQISQKYAGTLSREELIDRYIEEMKKDLCANMSPGPGASRSDVSMNSDLQQDAQSTEETEEIIISLDDALETLKDSLKQGNN